MQSQDSRPARLFIAIFAICLAATAILTQPMQAKTKFKVLHTFHGPNGAIPVSQLALDTAGNFYGTTSGGGKPCTYFKAGCGTAFKLDKSGKQVWVHSFNGKNGLEPYAGLLQDKAGSLYGTALLGGDTHCDTDGCGAVFKLDNAGKETVLYRFKGPPDAGYPEALLISDPTGNLYGTTYMGGEGDLGTVFELNAANKETILYTFKGPANGGDGAFPYAGVIRDSEGNLYGGTGDGGADGKGTVFELDTSGNERMLYDFTGGADGAGAPSVLLMDSSGNLYGTVPSGGNEACGYDCGAVFELSPEANGGWKETTLYTFCSLTGCADGDKPLHGPLVMDKQGNLYGTTDFGGKSSQCNGTCGVVFKLDSKGRETVLYNFTGMADGGAPAAGLLMDKAGNLYGTTQIGGDLACPEGNGYGCGVVFELTP